MPGFTLLPPPGPTGWVLNPELPSLWCASPPDPTQAGQGGLSSSLLGSGNSLYIRGRAEGDSSIRDTSPSRARLTSREYAWVHEGGHTEVGQHEEEDNSIVDRNDWGDVQTEPWAPAGTKAVRHPGPVPQVTPVVLPTAPCIAPRNPHSPRQASLSSDSALRASEGCMGANHPSRAPQLSL